MKLSQTKLLLVYNYVNGTVNCITVRQCREMHLTVQMNCVSIKANDKDNVSKKRNKYFFQ